MQKKKGRKKRRRPIILILNPRRSRTHLMEPQVLRRTIKRNLRELNAPIV